MSLTITLILFASCGRTGEGVPPPRDKLYFPTGLAVSKGGSALYVVNSDFDLQYSGGTLQVFDLKQIKKDILRTIEDPHDPALPFVRSSDREAKYSCEQGTAVGYTEQPINQSCAPPMYPKNYLKDSLVLGAFSTDILQSKIAHLNDQGKVMRRMFVPVRGDSSITWFDVEDDENNPDADPFILYCGKDDKGRNGRCNDSHRAGREPSEVGNTRNVTLPGEPFALSQTDDGSAMVVTHLNSDKASLFLTGIDGSSAQGLAPAQNPSIQFVLDKLPLSNSGIALIPYDKDAFDGVAKPALLPSFLLTSRSQSQSALLRLHTDDGSSLKRPFLSKDAEYSIRLSLGGKDSRDVVFDPSSRIECKAKLSATDTEGKKACARLPARVYITSRSPSSLYIGEIGQSDPNKGDSGEAYDPNQLVLKRNVPLSSGASRVYIAPIIDDQGRYALRVFIVCYDSASIYIYDPDSDLVEAIVRVGAGPFAMTFDPFSFEDVALRKQADTVSLSGELGHRYRFAYVASFSESYIQALDLDNTAKSKAHPTQSTFERIVFTLGEPTKAKGS